MSGWGTERALLCWVASVMPDSLQSYGLLPPRLLCPWDSPGKNSGLGHHVLLQEILPTQWWNSGLLHCRWILYHWATCEVKRKTEGRIILRPMSLSRLAGIRSSTAQFSHSVVSDSLQPHESQHARPPCPSTPGVHSDSRPSRQWCHPAISSSVVPFSSCPQSLPASESFPMSQFFAWGGQSI